MESTLLPEARQRPWHPGLFGHDMIWHSVWRCLKTWPLLILQRTVCSSCGIWSLAKNWWPKPLHRRPRTLPLESLEGFNFCWDELLGTSCHGRWRAPWVFCCLFDAFLCFSVFVWWWAVGWGGVGWDVNVHVHVTLMMLRWSWGGVGWGGMLTFMFMLRWWCSVGGVGWGGI